MTISVLKSRAALEAVPVQIEPPVWDEVARELKSLVGMEGVREELLTIARTLQNIKAHRERHQLRHLPQLQLFQPWGQQPFSARRHQRQ